MYPADKGLPTECEYGCSLSTFSIQMTFDGYHRISYHFRHNTDSATTQYQTTCRLQVFTPILTSVTKLVRASTQMFSFHMQYTVKILRRDRAALLYNSPLSQLHQAFGATYVCIVYMQRCLTLMNIKSVRHLKVYLSD